MKPKKHKPSGFTLVELLVVIAIVATLAAIVLSVTSRMRKSANQAVTTANLRQIGVALITFTADKGRFPSRNTDPVWDRAIMSNLGYDLLTGNGNITRSQHPGLEAQAKIFTTPEDKEPRSPDIYPRSFAIVPWTTNWSNGTAFRGWKDRPLNAGIPYSSLHAPEKAAMVVQGYHGIGGPQGLPPNYLGSGNHGFKDMGGPTQLLGTYQQVLFADGHIEKIPANMKNSGFVTKYWPGTIGNLN